MNIAEFDRIIGDAMRDADALEKTSRVLDLLVADARLVQYAHGLFLPAAGDYLRGKPGANHHFGDARVRRARL